MDWQNQMNIVMDYIDDNLTYNVDIKDICKIMSCSEWEFRRLFSFLTNMSLSEYVRNRRLTMAAEEINEGTSMTQVSLKYGYESQTSFSRAFKKYHGETPSNTRSRKIIMNPCPKITFKLVLKEDYKMDNDTNQSISIIGGGDVGYALSIELDKERIHETNGLFWDEFGNMSVGTTSLPQYGAYTSEEKCKLLGDVTDKKILEIGCGTGDSLLYINQLGQAELWGLDISEEQIKKTKSKFDQLGLKANLVCSPMEDECGLPNDYFDIIYSVYGIGWTTDLNLTFDRINSYLKKGGEFIFSWSHPIHKCVAVEGNDLYFKKSYFDEGWYSVPRRGGVLSLSDRKISTYINALSKSGFMIEEMIEETDEDMLRKAETKFSKKAKMLPVTFVIKAIKL